MSKIQLFIAASLDGKIARPDGSVGWLDEYAHPEGEDYGYGKFYAKVGAVVMGRKTYADILGFDVPWPYADARTYIVTSDRELATPTHDTTLLHDISPDAVRQMLTETDGNVWVVGGGAVISAFLTTELVDEMLITVIPRILGAGVPLFPDGTPETHLELVSTESFPTGFVNLMYTRKNP